MVQKGTPTVLVVDDEVDIRTIVRVVFESASPPIDIVGEAVDGDEALVAMRSLAAFGDPDVVILDHRMPGRSGIETARRILEEVPDQPIILFGTTISAELEAEATAAGIAACIGKLDVHDLPALVAALAESSTRSTSGPRRRRRTPLTAPPRQ